MSGDQINGIFEMLAAIFLLNHCRALEKDKQVRGVSISSVWFFTLYGLFNIYYYPSLHQWISFFAGLYIMAVNILYLSLLIKYKNK